MKKQLLNNKSISFPQELICSSIRINEEEEHEKNTKFNKNQQNSKNDGEKIDQVHKRYHENVIAGLQMSLEINGSRDNFLELMRSKSAKQIIELQKQQLAKSKDEKSGYAASLYNTSSFDQLTMNITHTPTQHNLSNINAFNQPLNENKSQALQRPTQMQSFQESYLNGSITINVNKQKNINNPTSTLGKNKDEDQKLSFIKNRAKIIEQLKYSIAETNREETEQAINQNYQQPYFKTPQLKQLSSDNNMETQRQRNRLQVGGNFSNKLKKYTSLEGEKVVEKKLTLRDYIYLQKLQGKNRDKTPHTSQKEIYLKQPNSPSPTTPSSPRLSTSRKKKVQSSNSQVLKLMKQEINQNIKLIQDRLDQARQYVNNYQESQLADHQDIMKLYNLGRIIKDRMLIGNKDIAGFLKMHKI